MKDIVELIVGEIDRLKAEIDYSNFEKLAEVIAVSPQVFLTGAGRSGEMMKCLAKRLMHSNIKSYMVGETTTAKAQKGDLLIIGTGSGETESLQYIGKKAKSLGVKLAVITTNPSSTIAKMSDYVLVIPASTPKSTDDTVRSKQPMANLFEQYLLITGDALGMLVARKQGMTFEEMFDNHANLE